jgi:hypothetical protein
MTWAYSGSKKVQVDLFDIGVPDGIDTDSMDGLTKHYDLIKEPSPFAYESLELIRERAMGRVAAVADELYETAPQPTAQGARSIFGRNVRGDWTTADLVAKSSLRLFFGLLDQPLNQEQAGAPRRARNARSRARDGDPIQIAVTKRFLVVVARDSTEEPDWSEVARRIEQAGE